MATKKDNRCNFKNPFMAAINWDAVDKNADAICAILKQGGRK